MDEIKSKLEFLANVAVDKEVRYAADDSYYAISSFESEKIRTNKNLYHKIEMVNENIKKGRYKAPKNEEDKRLLDQINQEFKSSGIDLPAEQSEELVNLENRYTELVSDIFRCIAEDDSNIIFTKKELEGVSEDFFDNLPKITKNGEEAYILKMKASTYTPVIKFAKNPETRKAIMTRYGQRCRTNVDDLKEIANIQFKMAKLRGYKSHSEYRLESKMAKNTQNVYNFLDSLKQKIQPIAKAEMDKLLELKKVDMEETDQPFDNTLTLSDLEYYKRILVEQEYSINNAEISEYFPIDYVTEEILSLYEEIFSLTFEEVETPVVWHEDVRQFKVFDKKTEDFLGSFYLDLYPRDGKVNYEAAFHISYGYKKENGKRHYPSAALVVNFAKPTPSKPSLLSHYDVTVYFHELGHVFHEIISKTKYVRFNGYNVEQDFLEAPSQMLEYWCWEPEIIERLSHHYQDKDKRLPKHLIDAIIKSKNVNSGLYNIRQIFMGYVDMALFSIEAEDENLDPIKIWDDLRKEVTMMESLKDTWSVAVFDHIVDGYDAGYYGYLWSQVYSADMYFSEFKKHGILDRKTGQRYRRYVLKPGATKDGMDILKKFLGREPNDDAFVKSLGI